MKPWQKLRMRSQSHDDLRASELLPGDVAQIIYTIQANTHVLALMPCLTYTVPVFLRCYCGD